MIQLLFLMVLILAVPPVFGQDADRVLKPVIEVGDRWTYRGVNMLGPGSEEYDIQVVNIDKGLMQVVCTRKRDGREFDGVYTEEWSASTSCSGFIQKPPPRFLRFPLVPGVSYPIKYISHRARAHTHTSSVEGSVEVKGWETITVPAGRFRVMRIEATMDVSQPDGTGQRRRSTIWYSPEARATVKIENYARGGDTFESELLSYKLVE